MNGKIVLDGIECKKQDASVGEAVVDLSPVLKREKSWFFDPGFVNTAACESKITYIDGDAGVLMHRGYKIEDIAEKKNFIETAYLILNGEFPDENEVVKFQEKLSQTTPEFDVLRHVFDAIPDGNHPMATMMTLMSSIAGLRAPIRKSGDNYNKCLDAIRHMLYIAAMAGCKLNGQKFYPANHDVYYTQAFMQMFLGESLASNKVAMEALDKILILHIDHEQNASTSTVRMIGSTKCDLYGSVVGGLAALWGPLHGGANEAVLKMLEEVGSKKNVGLFIEKIKNKVDGALLMGFGHRVYKNYDPRAATLKKYCANIISQLGKDSDGMLEVAMEIERIALSDDYFISRKLFPNVDFYSGIIYKAMGIPTKMFTGMFALSRIVGWCSQWLESTTDKDGKIWRPRQLYTGYTQRKI